ncbi:ATPase, T2SS/T4P/T4SS family, partial [Peribacillus simplex]
FLRYSHGLLVFTGPTGSGKTTTMYALLEVIRKRKTRRIVTLEDPVEKRKDDLLQIQINEKAGITYEAGLKAILRHDPDIILVGE